MTVDGAKSIFSVRGWIGPDKMVILGLITTTSDLAGKLLTEDAQWRKLEVMLQTAEQVWG